MVSIRGSLEADFIQSYMHGQGVCHRDLKPENILLSMNGVLKICDFGLCAVFRYKGSTRKLKDRCGSLPYIAPEVGRLSNLI